ncbi:MAG: InlB B-repeat-containing protein, partial [Clostridia bacterium]|nr:InlB B-repeat-containing protein [Clostridia bacterium]
MKKNLSKLILILLLAVLVLSLVACTPEAPPTPDDGGDDPTTETPDPVTFTVTFDSKGGTGIEKQTGIEFGQGISAPTSTPTKVGYTFDCWMMPDGQTPVDFNSYVVYADVTFYASWIAKTYDINAYLSDEGRKDKILGITTDTVSEYYGDTMSVNDKFSLEKVEVEGVETWSVKNILLRYEGTTTSSTQSLPVPTTTKAGDRFMYWYCYDGDTIVPVSEILPLGSTDQYVDLLNAYQYDGSMTIYAMWYSALDNITVKFDTTDQSAPVSMDDVIIKEGDHLSRPNDPTANGYDFNGWTYILIDKDNEDENTNKTVVEMDFYSQPTHHGTHISWDMTTDGVFTLYANWIKHIDIASASDWTGLNPNDEAVQNANIYLVNDIKLDDYAPIFDDETPFCGVFDGNGITISYTISTSENGFYSFIGVNNGTIKNLVVNNVTIAENTPSDKK